MPTSKEKSKKKGSKSPTPISKEEGVGDEVSTQSTSSEEVEPVKREAKNGSENETVEEKIKRLKAERKKAKKRIMKERKAREEENNSVGSGSAFYHGGYDSDSSSLSSNSGAEKLSLPKDLKKKKALKGLAKQASKSSLLDIASLPNGSFRKRSMLNSDDEDDNSSNHDDSEFSEFIMDLAFLTNNPNNSSNNSNTTTTINNASAIIKANADNNLKPGISGITRSKMRRVKSAGYDDPDNNLEVTDLKLPTLLQEKINAAKGKSKESDKSERTDKNSTSQRKKSNDSSDHTENGKSSSMLSSSSSMDTPANANWWQMSDDHSDSTAASSGRRRISKDEKEKLLSEIEAMAMTMKPMLVTPLTKKKNQKRSMAGDLADFRSSHLDFSSSDEDSENESNNNLPGDDANEKGSTLDEHDLEGLQKSTSSIIDGAVKPKASKTAKKVSDHPSFDDFATRKPKDEAPRRNKKEKEGSQDDKKTMKKVKHDKKDESSSDQENNKPSASLPDILDTGKQVKKTKDSTSFDGSERKSRKMKKEEKEPSLDNRDGGLLFNNPHGAEAAKNSKKVKDSPSHPDPEKKNKKSRDEKNAAASSSVKNDPNSSLDEFLGTTKKIKKAKDATSLDSSERMSLKSKDSKESASYSVEDLTLKVKDGLKPESGAVREGKKKKSRKEKEFGNVDDDIAIQEKRVSKSKKFMIDSRIEATEVDNGAVESASNEVGKKQRPKSRDESSSPARESTRDHKKMLVLDDYDTPNKPQNRKKEKKEKRRSSELRSRGYFFDDNEFCDNDTELIKHESVNDAEASYDWSSMKETSNIEGVDDFVAYNWSPMRYSKSPRSPRKSSKAKKPGSNDNSKDFPDLPFNVSSGEEPPTTNENEQDKASPRKTKTRKAVIAAPPIPFNEGMQDHPDVRGGSSDEMRQPKDPVIANIGEKEELIALGSYVRTMFAVLLYEPKEYSEEAIMALLQEFPKSASIKLEVDGDALGGERGSTRGLFLFSVLCALGASFTVISYCYNLHPEAIMDVEQRIGTPLHYAISFGIEAASAREEWAESFFPVLEFLMEKEPAMVVSQRNRLSQSVLHQAILSLCCPSSTSEKSTEKRRLVALGDVVVSMLLECRPGLATLPDAESMVPLHLAAMHAIQSDILNRILVENVGACSVKCKTRGFTPLHYSLEATAKAALEAFEKVTHEFDASDPDKQSNAGKATVVNKAFSVLDNHVKGVDALVKSWPLAAQIRDHDGNLPLHVFVSSCRGSNGGRNSDLLSVGPTALVHVLASVVQAFPDAVSTPCSNGETPLTIATDGKASDAILDVMHQT